MDTIEGLRAFFGWCSVISIGVLALSSFGVVALRGWVFRVHGKMFRLSEDDLSRAYFQYLAHFKIAVIVLNIVPYFALVMMG